MTDPKSIISQRRRSHIALLGVVTLGLLLRLWHPGAQSLSMDEITDSGIAAQAIRSIVLTQDGFPPLYSLVAHLWLEVFKDPASLRILSVAFGVASILVVWQLGRLAGGELVGLLAGFLLAISPLHISFSQEARSYALYFLLAVLGIWLFYRARLVPRAPSWAPYIIVAVLGFYTHYYYAVLILTLCLTVALGPESWRSTRGLLRAHLAVVALATPGLFLLQGDLGLQQGFTLARPEIGLSTIAYTGFTFLAGLGIGPSSRELHTLHGSEVVREVLPWVLVIGPSVSYLLMKAVASPGRTSSAGRHLAVLTAFPVILCVLMGAVLGLGFRIRYVVWCGAPLLVLLALGAAQKLRSWPTLLGMAVLVVVSALSTINRSTVGRYMNEDLRGTASFLLRPPTLRPLFSYWLVTWPKSYDTTRVRGSRSFR